MLQAYCDLEWETDSGQSEEEIVFLKPLEPLFLAVMPHDFLNLTANH